MHRLVRPYGGRMAVDSARIIDTYMNGKNEQATPQVTHRWMALSWTARAPPAHRWITHKDNETSRKVPGVPMRRAVTLLVVGCVIRRGCGVGVWGLVRFRG